MCATALGKKILLVEDGRAEDESAVLGLILLFL